jgi:hypothetical protein
MKDKEIGFILGMAIICGIVLTASKSNAEDIDVSIGLYQPIPYNWAGTTGAEYGSGPMVMLEATRPITKDFDLSLIHKSYLLTGAPFNNNYESSFTAIGFKWRVSL